MANFIEVKSNGELEQLFEDSKNKSVVLFKHSLTCPISAGVYQEVAQFDGDVNLVVVQHSREVSNEIAEKTGITHHSPQAIVLQDGKAIYHASHYDITTEDIEKVSSSKFQVSS